MLFPVDVSDGFEYTSPLIKPVTKVGVTKLNETNAMVEGLKGDLTKLEPILEQASKDAEKLLKQVEIDKADAAKVKEKVRRQSLAFVRSLWQTFSSFALDMNRQN